MEDQLLDTKFNAAQFLEKQLAIIQENSDLDLQLTDLTFTLGLIQSENNEKINYAANSIVQNKNDVIQETQLLFNEVQQFKPLLNEYVNQLVPTKQPQRNVDLYQKIQEIVEYQEKIGSTLEMFEVVMQLDNIYEQYSRWVEEENAIDLSKDILKNSQTYMLLLELPNINPRCGQSEKIIELVKIFCLSQFEKYFRQEQQFEQVQHLLDHLVLILVSLKLEGDLIQCYRKVRVDWLLQKHLNSQFELVLQQKQIQVVEAHQLISELCADIEQEIQYLDCFSTDDLKAQMLNEYLKFLIKFFNQNLFRKFFTLDVATQHYSANKVLELFLAWLNLYNFIHNLLTKNVLRENDFIQLLRVGFHPYQEIIPNLVSNEITLLKQIIYKKINDKEHQQMISSIEKLQDFEFSTFNETLESSFKRVNEICFAISIEDWIFECVKLFDGFFLRLGTFLDEISSSFQSDGLGEYVNLIMERIKLKKTKSSSVETYNFQKLSINFNKKTKNLLRNNFQLFECLLIKHAEIQDFKNNVLFHLDQIIKTTLQRQQISSIVNEDLQKILNIILHEKLSTSKAANYLLSSNYSNQLNVNEYLKEISLTESLYPSIEVVEMKIISIQLKLLVSDAYNYLCESVDAEFMDQILQQFMGHIEIIGKTFQQLSNSHKIEYNSIINIYLSIQLDLQKVQPDNLSIQKEINQSLLKTMVENFEAGNVFTSTTLFWAFLYAISLQIIIQLALKQIDPKQTQLVQNMQQQTERILEAFIIKPIVQDIWNSV